MTGRSRLAIAILVALGLAAGWYLIAPLLIDRQVQEDPPMNVARTERVEASELPDLALAPELQNQTWLNVDHPLRLSELRGSVVALEMWTFG